MHRGKNVQAAASRIRFFMVIVLAIGFFPFIGTPTAIAEYPEREFPGPPEAERTWWQDFSVI
jgi:hypothetical protein